MLKVSVGDSSITLLGDRWGAKLSTQQAGVTKEVLFTVRSSRGKLVREYRVKLLLGKVEGFVILSSFGLVEGYQVIENSCMSSSLWFSGNRGESFFFLLSALMRRNAGAEVSGERARRWMKSFLNFVEKECYRNILSEMGVPGVKRRTNRVFSAGSVMISGSSLVDKERGVAILPKVKDTSLYARIVELKNFFRRLNSFFP